MYRCLLFLFLFLNSGYVTCQVFPKEDSHLNFRIIGFSFPVEKKTGTCALEIALGHFNDMDSFKKNIIKTLVCKTNKVIVEVPEFGSDYSWRTTYNDKGRIAKDNLHHFSTTMSARIDTSLSRLRIIKEAGKYKDAYLFVDITSALYDIKGNAVWFLPSIDNDKVTENSAIRDVKLTPQATITFSTGNDIYEINYNGTILWKGPNTGEVSGDSIEHYHHEFTRLSNGHYMALGTEPLTWELPKYKVDSAFNPAAAKIIKDSNNNFHQNMQFGTVIEYDQSGKVLWSWKSIDYFKNSDLVNTKNGVFEMADPHQNSFFFDEQNSILYVSFRDISRIVKVKYPEGKIMAAYGTEYTPDIDELGNNMFHGQHSVKHSKDGYLYLYNNNGFSTDVLPKIDVMQEPVSEKDTLKKIWEYQCTLDGLTENEINIYKRQLEQKKQMDVQRQLKENTAKQRKKIQLTGGGNVIELPDHDIFVSMSGPFCQIFIVNRDQKIIWSSILEKRETREENWRQQSTYRASIITDRKDLEQLIWNAEM